jgi:hypothetical protein
MTMLDGSPSPGGTHEYALWDAAYLLGSLSAAERREYEAHLRSCQPCTDAVGELSGVPALLSQIDRNYVDTIDELGPHLGLPPLRDAVLANVNSRRRRSRALTWTLAAGRGLGTHDDTDHTCTTHRHSHSQQPRVGYPHRRGLQLHPRAAGHQLRR